MKKNCIGALLLTCLLPVCKAQLPLLETEGTYFVQAATRHKVVLKGLAISNNVWGFYEWPKSDSLEKAGMNPLVRARELKPFVFTADDVDRIAQLDGNVVRYCFNDELFHVVNPKRQANIEQLRSHISLLASKGIYSFVTMQVNPGLDGHNDNYERRKPGHLRIPSPFESDSVFKLWRDTWQYVAKNLQDLNAIAGYELIVEPKRPALADASTQDLVKAYVEVIDSIRSVDRRHIVMVPEFNSREANPGETYWDEAKAQNVTDRGEQGTIWGRNWLELPKSIPNLVYVAHIYDPFEFTSTKTMSTFNVAQLQNIVSETANWVYAQNKPLYTSEYGVIYAHTLNSNNAKRIEWLRTMHDAFEAHHVSTTLWQYKDLLTPWVDMEQAFGLWMHYYDTSTIKSIANGKVEYVDEATRSAAITAKVDPILNEFFIENGKLKSVSLVNNQSVVDEMNRYFGVVPLGLNRSSKVSDHMLYADKEALYIKGLPNQSSHLHIALFSQDGRPLLDTNVAVQEGKAQLMLNKLNLGAAKIVVVNYGTKGEWSGKVYLP